MPSKYTVPGSQLFRLDGSCTEVEARSREAIAVRVLNERRRARKAFATADFREIERRIFNQFISQGYRPGVHDEMIAPEWATPESFKRDVAKICGIPPAALGREARVYVKPEAGYGVAAHPSFIGSALRDLKVPALWNHNPRTLLGFPVVEDPTLGPGELRFGRSIDLGYDPSTSIAFRRSGNLVSLDTETTPMSKFDVSFSATKPAAPVKPAKPRKLETIARDIRKLKAEHAETQAKLTAANEAVRKLSAQAREEDERYFALTTELHDAI